MCGRPLFLPQLFRQVCQVSRDDLDAAAKAVAELMARMMELVAQMLELRAWARDRQRRERLERRVHREGAEVWDAERQLKAAGFARDIARGNMDGRQAAAARAAHRVPTLVDEGSMEDGMQLG